ncbi:MAG: hypothetical protein JXR19_11795 [Bacteroidia bacterium]
MLVKLEYKNVPFVSGLLNIILTLVFTQLQIYEIWLFVVLVLNAGSPLPQGKFTINRNTKNKEDIQINYSVDIMISYQLLILEGLKMELIINN